VVQVHLHACARRAPLSEDLEEPSGHCRPSKNTNTARRPAWQPG